MRYFLERIANIVSPRLFWLAFTPAFYQDSWQHRIFPQHRWLLKKIQSIRPKKILEVGCGFGRNLKYLVDNDISPQSLYGSDFNPLLLRKAKNSLDSNIKLELADIINLPYPNSSFDLVFTHGVLMHIAPNQIDAAVKELARVTRKHLILIEETRADPSQLNHYTWAHDYEQLIKSQHLNIKEKKKNAKHHLIWLHLTK